MSGQFMTCLTLLIYTLYESVRTKRLSTYKKHTVIVQSVYGIKYTKIKTRADSLRCTESTTPKENRTIAFVLFRNKKKL